MTRLDRLLGGVVLACLLVSLAGCPDDELKASTWTKKLGDSKDGALALQKLEQLGDPSAIPAIGDAWKSSGRPEGLLQVIISLARPLTPKQAEAEFYTDYQTNGRPASWAAALPYLNQAVLEVDEASPRQVESAAKAAEAIGNAALSDGLDALAELAKKPVTEKLLDAQMAAIRAMGKFTEPADKTKAVAALKTIIEREPPANPRTEKDAAKQRLLVVTYTMFQKTTAAAINAVGDMRATGATEAIALAMYRTPDLFGFCRRALVAAGPDAEKMMREILRGDNKAVNDLFLAKKLDKYCGDAGDYKPEQCSPLGAKDFYAAVVLGDFYDPASVADLLTALKRPMLAQYYNDDQPSGSTNYTAIFSALKKIGSAEAAPTVRAMWDVTAPAPAKAPPKKGAKGAPAAAPAPAAGADTGGVVRTLAVDAYPFLARDASAAPALAKIADSPGDNGLRASAAAAFARLTTDSKDIGVLEHMAQLQFDVAKKNEDVAAKEKDKATAADKDFETVTQQRNAAKAGLQKLIHDPSKSDAQKKEAKDADKKFEDDYKAEKKKHAELTGAFHQATDNAKVFKSFGRQFQSHVGRIVVALRCKEDLNCYAKTLTLKPDEAANDCAQYIKDIKDWTAEEKGGLVDAEVERAMLEIGKRGTGAAALTDQLLEAAKSDDHGVRESVLLALPKIAKVPCANCEAKLDEAIKAGEGKSTVRDLNVETQMLRNYFSWAGGKTPSAAPPPPSVDDAGAGPGPAKAPPKKKTK